MQSILIAIKNGASLNEILDRMKQVYPELSSEYSADELEQMKEITSILHEYMIARSKNKKKKIKRITKKFREAYKQLQYIYMDQSQLNILTPEEKEELDQHFTQEADKYLEMYASNNEIDEKGIAGLLKELN